MRTKAHHAACGVQIHFTRYTPGPRYTKRDFEFVAKAFRDAHTELAGEHDHATMMALAWQFCRRFKADNPRFEELKFIAACTESV